AGHQVRRARAGSRDADADPPAGARVAVGGERRPLLVAHQHMLQRRAVERVVERHDRAAGVAEERIDALGLECLHQPVRTVHYAASFWSLELSSHTIFSPSFLPTCSIWCSRSACLYFL